MEKTFTFNELDTNKVYEKIGFNEYREVTGLDAWCDKHPYISGILIGILTAATIALYSFLFA